MSYDLEDLGRYYLSYRSLMTHWHRLMPGALHSVSYELLVEDLEGETRRFFLCDLPWQANCIEFHRNTAASTTASASQIRQPIYNSSVDKWKHYAEQLMPSRDCSRRCGLSTRRPTSGANLIMNDKYLHVVMPSHYSFS